MNATGGIRAPVAFGAHPLDDYTVPEVFEKFSHGHFFYGVGPSSVVDGVCADLLIIRAHRLRGEGVAEGDPLIEGPWEWFEENRKDRPVRNALPRMSARRGGVSFVTSPVLSDG